MVYAHSLIALYCIHTPIYYTQTLIHPYTHDNDLNSYTNSISYPYTHSDCFKFSIPTNSNPCTHIDGFKSFLYSVGNHFFQTLANMASGLKQVLVKMK